MVADLHIHTKNSDGTDSLEDILRLVGNQEAILAITDHHFLSLAKPQKMENVIAIPGIEVSGMCNGKSCHFTAYSLDPKPTVELQKMSEMITAGYAERARKIVKKLNDHGYHITGPVIYTYNIARKMKSLLNMNFDSEVIKWAKENGDLFHIEENNFMPDVREIVQRLHDSNFKVFWAHPGTRYLKLGSPPKEYETMLFVMKNERIDGVECFCPAHSPEQTETFLKTSQKYGLAVSGGSDYHGIGRGMSLPQLCLPHEYTLKFMDYLKETL